MAEMSLAAKRERAEAELHEIAHRMRFRFYWYALRWHLKCACLHIAAALAGPKHAAHLGDSSDPHTENPYDLD